METFVIRPIKTQFLGAYNGDFKKNRVKYHYLTNTIKMCNKTISLVIAFKIILVITS